MHGVWVGQPPPHARGMVPSTLALYLYSVGASMSCADTLANRRSVSCVSHGCHFLVPPMHTLCQRVSFYARTETFISLFGIQSGVCESYMGEEQTDNCSRCGRRVGSTMCKNLCRMCALLVRAQQMWIKSRTSYLTCKHTCC
jgi:hypothetical protein